MEKIKLDLIPSGKMPSLHASQYDDGRDYHIDLTENRVPYVLDGTETISLTVRKCDNTLVTMDIANVFGGKSYIEFRTTEQMNACAGFNYGEITIEKNGTRIGSLNFYLQVEGAPDEGGITSQSEINNLNRQIDEHIDEVLPDMVEDIAPTIVEDVAPTVVREVAPAIIEDVAPPILERLAPSAVESVAPSIVARLVPTEVAEVAPAVVREVAAPIVEELVPIAVGDNYYNKVQADGLLADKADKSELTNVYNKKAGENLADDRKFVTGAIQNDGTIATIGSYANYITSDFIPLEANKKYTVSTWYTSGIHATTRIIYLLYSDIDTPVSATYYNSSSSDHATFNSGNYKYIRVATSKSYNLMVSKGDTPSAFVEYSEHYEIKCYLGDTSIAQVKGIIEGNKSVKLVKSGNTITITSKAGSKTLQRSYKLTNVGYSNEVFNFVDALLDGNIIKSCSDDITPIRVIVSNSETTIGSNHGWNFAYACEKGNLTAIDIGSLWSDGTTQYMLVSVFNGYAYFVPPVTKSAGMIYCSAIDPVSDLVHVSGATHTDTIAKASLSRSQLYPSINNRSVTLLLDGEEVTEDGTYYPSKVQVIETYGIMDLYELYVYAGNNVGDVDYDEVATLCTMSFIYEITDNAEIVYTNLTADENCPLGNCGFLQASIISAVGGSVYRYVNGLDSGVFDSTSLVAMASYNTDVNITSSEVKTGQFPNRCVDVCKDNSNNILYGFAIGYVPDIGEASDTKRSSNTKLWDMRSTKKIYPVCIEANTRTLSQGEQVDVVGYRAYFGAMTEATDKFSVKVGDKIYSIFDAHSTANGRIEGSKLGNKVESVNNDGSTVGDFVNANGISYYSANSYSAFVVKS